MSEYRIHCFSSRYPEYSKLGRSRLKAITNLSNVCESAFILSLYSPLVGNKTAGLSDTGKRCALQREAVGERLFLEFHARTAEYSRLKPALIGHTPAEVV